MGRSPPESPQLLADLSYKARAVWTPLTKTAPPDRSRGRGRPAELAAGCERGELVPLMCAQMLLCVPSVSLQCILEPEAASCSPCPTPILCILCHTVCHPGWPWIPGG